MGLHDAYVVCVLRVDIIHMIRRADVVICAFSTSDWRFNIIENTDLLNYISVARGVLGMLKGVENGDLPVQLVTAAFGQHSGTVRPQPCYSLVAAVGSNYADIPSNMPQQPLPERPKDALPFSEVLGLVRVAMWR